MFTSCVHNWVENCFSFLSPNYFRCTKIYFHVISFVRSVALPLNHTRRQKKLLRCCCFFRTTPAAFVSCFKHVYGTGRKLCSTRDRRAEVGCCVNLCVSCFIICLQYEHHFDKSLTWFNFYQERARNIY